MACTSTFKTPSPIQAQAWPILLSGRDMIGIAATGSGKTLAFMLPALVHIQAKRAAGRVGAAGAAAAAGAGRGKRVCYPTVLVLAPTRELAMQTAKVSTEAGAAVGVRTVCIFGGMPKHTQREELLAEGGAHVVVATPGRLLDHMQDGVLNLSAVSVLVLDEADRMLDMGFEKDIRQVVAVVPPASTSRRGVASLDGSVRQTLMFSATWPPAIQAIAAEFLAHPVKVVVGSVELAASASITQIVEVLEPAAKDATLLRLLGKYHASRKNRVLVFCLYKKEADRVERFLSGRGWSCGAIHGDMSQEARIRAFNAFKEARVPLLIATDVAARGLDIPAVEYVINYTFPLTIEDYVHRIGRTGRGGATGTAHTLFTSLDKAHAGELANVLKEAGVAIPDALTKFGLHVKRKEHALYGAHFKGGADGSAPPAPTRMTFD
jgi:ATP-dependent RNA helicase DBP3